VRAAGGHDVGGGGVRVTVESRGVPGRHLRDAAPGPTDDLGVATAGSPDRHTSVTARLCHHIAAVTGHPAARITPATAYADLGLDSLMAVRIRTALERDLAIELPLRDLLNATTIEETASRIQRALPRRGGPDETSPLAEEPLEAGPAEGESAEGDLAGGESAEARSTETTSVRATRTEATSVRVIPAEMAVVRATPAEAASMRGIPAEPASVGDGGASSSTGVPSVDAAQPRPTAPSAPADATRRTPPSAVAGE
ncbi:phosphopantetheine-binding protein, partial [Streptomyces caniscabiei]